MMLPLRKRTRRGCFPAGDSKPLASRTEAVEEFTEAAREEISDMGTGNTVSRGRGG